MRPPMTPRERLLLPDCADAARHALAAGLVAEERGDPQHDVGQVDVLVEHHHDARPERDPGRPRVLEREPQVEVVRPDELDPRRRRAGSPSAPCPADAAGELEYCGA